MMYLQPGQMVDNYEIIGLIAEGGMAVVYKAYQAAMDRYVAIKVISHQLMRDKTFLARFQQEARLIAKLEHPNILPVYDYGEISRPGQGSQPYLVMRYMDEGTLQDRIQDNPLSLEEIDQLFTQLALALAYAHEMGIIHRDIKPANVMLDKRGQLFLSDFGIAKQAEGDVQVTASGMVTGTPAYMSPEQAEGKRVDQRSDIYALGIVLYEMLTGKVPFDAETPVGLLIQQIQSPLPLPTRFRPGLSKAIEAVIVKALAKNADDRFQTVRDFLAAWRKAYTVTKKRQPVAEVEASMVKGSVAAPSELPHGESVGERAVPSEAGRQLTPPEPRIPVSMPARRLHSRLPWLYLLPALVIGMAVLAGLFTLIFGSALIASRRGSKVTLVAINPSTATLALTLVTATEEATPSPVPTLGLGSRMVSPRDGMQMVYIPAGEFLMGSSDSDPDAMDDEKPQRSVTLNAYWIAMTEVTNAMFARFVEASGYVSEAELSGKSFSLDFESGEWGKEIEGASWRKPQGVDSDLTGLENHPVTHISWNDADAYCQWVGGRLPSEAEWEKAARGVDGRIYPWGDDPPTGKRLNFADVNLKVPIADQKIDDGYAFTSPVASYPDGVSPFGLFDMAGNVFEWVNDWYGEDYYANAPSFNPLGAESGIGCVLRGGCWGCTIQAVRVAYRDYLDPSSAGVITGFRCAMDVIPTEE